MRRYNLNIMKIVKAGQRRVPRYIRGTQARMWVQVAQYTEVYCIVYNIIRR